MSLHCLVNENQIPHLPILLKINKKTKKGDERGNFADFYLKTVKLDLHCTHKIIGLAKKN